MQCLNSTLQWAVLEFNPLKRHAVLEFNPFKGQCLNSIPSMGSA